MACEAELLQYQPADANRQDFLLAYQQNVLLALQRQGILNEKQFRDCMQKLREQPNI